MKAVANILLVVASLFSGYSVMAQSVTLVTLGDSLTAGDGDDGLGGGYPARLIGMLQTPYPGSVLHNLAISGDTSVDLINKQLDQAVSLLTAAPATNLKVALVWIGSNDLFGLYNSTVCADYYESVTSCELTELGLYSEHIDQILSTLRSTGAVVYIALLDDQSKRPVMVDPVLRMSQFEFITDDDVLRMAAQIPQYNSAIQIQANRHGASTVDFLNTTTFEDEATLSDDGNHPNGAGYDIIAGIWFAAVTGESAPPADVSPQISANAATGTVTVAAGESVTVTVRLDPGMYQGVNADWWAGYLVDGSWSTYVYPTEWGPGIRTAYQGRLFALAPFPVMDEVLGPGDYTFYFAIDTTPEGRLTASTLWYDSVRVRVE